MSTACDIRICTQDAIFSLREAAVGFVADVGVLQRIPLIVGQGHARELAYKEEYVSRYGHYPGWEVGEEYPEVPWSKSIRVEVGDWIGRIGDRGTGSGPHVHLEVYEYFRDSAVRREGKGGWQRVDPITVFGPGMITHTDTRIYDDHECGELLTIYGMDTEIGGQAGCRSHL